MSAPDLSRFLSAQDGVWETARAELQAGRKRSHWMWFVFPQLRGLGLSETARFYGIASRAEAEAFLRDPVLGARLVELFEVLLKQKGTAHEIFGSPDDLKLRSCATLFAALSGASPPFQAALDQFYGGKRDERTLALLGETNAAG